MLCQNCGRENPPRSRFCGHCGISMQARGPLPPPSAPRPESSETVHLQQPGDPTPDRPPPPYHPAQTAPAPAGGSPPTDTPLRAPVARPSTPPATDPYAAGNAARATDPATDPYGSPYATWPPAPSGSSSPIRSASPEVRYRPDPHPAHPAPAVWPSQPAAPARRSTARYLLLGLAALALATLVGLGLTWWLVVDRSSSDEASPTPTAQPAATAAPTSNPAATAVPSPIAVPPPTRVPVSLEHGAEIMPPAAGPADLGKLTVNNGTSRDAVAKPAPSTAGGRNRPTT
jgi:hypothetical protein